MPKRSQARRDKAQRAEYAVRYIIHHPKATYASVGRKFNLPVSAIRARIENRFGTLAYARTCNGVALPGTLRGKKKRKCMICHREQVMDQNHRICDPCKRSLYAKHDGYV